MGVGNNLIVKGIFIGIAIIFLLLLIMAVNSKWILYRYGIPKQSRKISDISLIPDNGLDAPIKFSEGRFLVNPNRLGELRTSERVRQHFNVSNHKVLFWFNESSPTIVCIGDSYTQGSGVGENETFCAFLHKLLARNVVNLGCGGYNTKLEVESLKIVGLGYKPKYVVLQYTFNDYEDPIELYSLMEHVLDTIKNLNLSVDAYLVNQQVYGFYNQEVYLKNPERLLNNSVIQPLRELGSLSIQHPFKVIIVKVPSPKNQEEILEGYAKKFGWSVLDLKEKIGFKLEPPYTISQQDQHFSVETHKLVAIALAEVIKSLEQ